MSELVAVPDAIRRYGDASAAMAAEVAAVGATNQAAVIAAAIPVFGLIGQDFLATFAVAQANNFGSFSEVAYGHAMTAVTAHESAAAYEATEEAAVEHFGGIASS